MSTLLIKLNCSRTLNRTIFQHKLFVYSDKLIFHTRNLLTQSEFSITYNHVAQVNLKKILLLPHAHIEIHTSAGEKIIAKFVPKNDAEKAKRIIDQKIYQAHLGVWEKENQKQHESSGAQNFERSLNRLEELLTRGVITKGEYNNKRKELLKKQS